MLCGYRIFPPSTGGNVHSTTIARALARMGHEVLVYCLAGRREDYSAGTWLGSPIRRTQIEPGLLEEVHLGPVFGVLQTIFRRLGVPRVWQFELLRLGLVPKRLRQALLHADIVISDFPFCPPIPGPWSHKPWFMISHELEFRLFQQGTAVERLFANRMRNIEKAAPKRYRDIFVCAQEDRDFFSEHDAVGRLKLPYIRCGVDAKAYVAEPGVRARVRAELGLTDADWLVVFSGSRYGPNLEAFEELKAFCRTEGEFLGRHRLYFLALGSMAFTPARDGALIVTGPVPEVIPYFAAGDAGLNPITRGSGSNVKLFEYLVARLPVISTQFGVRGTKLEPETDFLPFVPGELKSALQQFVEKRTRQEWQQYADQVLERHFRFCDIQELVRDAIAQLPEFDGNLAGRGPSSRTPIAQSVNL
jgi:glycosyltransferase involved in cell wall biosynthesis